MLPEIRTVTIDARFNGPPGSANGGYACGTAATALTDGPAEVVLRLPPPLGVAMDVVATPEGIELRHDGTLIAAATVWNGSTDVPASPSESSLHAAVSAFDVDEYARGHPFGGCFTCGPSRSKGDGLRIFPAGVDSHMVAWPWVPSSSTSGEQQLVAPAIVWAALDCPSGMCWISAPDGTTSGPAVLGRLAVTIERPLLVGEPLVVGGWQAGAEGRKRFSGSAVWSADGEVLASASATWIVLDPRQSEVFGVPGDRRPS